MTNPSQQHQHGDGETYQISPVHKPQSRPPRHGYNQDACSRLEGSTPGSMGLDGDTP